MEPFAGYSEATVGQAGACMHLDVGTLSVVTVFVTALLGALLVFAGMQNRTIRAPLWWGAAQIVGATGLGLLDWQSTPTGTRMPGIAIHAQLLENILEGTLLRRPAWAAMTELAWLLAIGIALIVVVPAARPRPASGSPPGAEAPGPLFAHLPPRHSARSCAETSTPSP